MNEYNMCLQTVAEISSAIAAIAALCVARSTFSFQRNLLLKKATIDQIMKLLSQLYHLRALTGQPVFGAADEGFTELQQQISETMHSVILLESLASASAGTEVKRVHDVVHSLREENMFASVASRAQLDDAISALHKIYCKEIK